MSEEEILKSKLKVSAILFSYNVPVEEAKIIGTFIEELQQENSQLKERIEKAIEIINQMIFNGYAKGGTIYMATSEKSEFGSRAKIILEVLKGDKE